MKIEVNTHEKNMIRFAAEHPEVLVMSADLGSSCEDLWHLRSKKVPPDLPGPLPDHGYRRAEHVLLGSRHVP